LNSRHRGSSGHWPAESTDDRSNALVVCTKQETGRALGRRISGRIGPWPDGLGRITGNAAAQLQPPGLVLFDCPRASRRWCTPIWRSPPLCFSHRGRMQHPVPEMRWRRSRPRCGENRCARDHDLYASVIAVDCRQVPELRWRRSRPRCGEESMHLRSRSLCICHSGRNAPRVSEMRWRRSRPQCGENRCTRDRAISMHLS
jgi:hypothetical protein